MNKQHSEVAQKEVAISGHFPRVARLRGEYHEYIGEPEIFLQGAKHLKADIFSFLQPVSDRKPKYDYPQDWDRVAVLPIETYEKWWKQQINDKTRNMVRKAGKKGVVIEPTQFNDDLVKGIHAIYNECPLRQGKPFRHYGKDLETLKRAHESYLDRSVFIGASLQGQLIGFIKMIMLGQSASIMQIISMISHRDKAPTNALLGKAVEVCAEQGVRYMQYGVWSRRSMGDFKLHHGFEPVEIPRYYVPLNWRGRIALGLKLHHNAMDFIPGGCQDALANLRAKWYAHKYRSAMQS